MTRNYYKLFTVSCVAAAVGVAQAQRTPIAIFNALLGTWVGTTKFNSPNPDLAKPQDASVKITTAVRGHYIQFERVLYLPGQPEETLSLLTFDPTAGLFEMWTFNQDSPGAHMLTGSFEEIQKEKGPTHKPPLLENYHLVLTSPAILENGTNVAYREIFTIQSPTKFSLEYDIRLHDKWHEDFTTTYTRKVEEKK